MTREQLTQAAIDFLGQKFNHEKTALCQPDLVSAALAIVLQTETKVDTAKGENPHARD